jgi:hypothetical protein
MNYRETIIALTAASANDAAPVDNSRRLTATQQIRWGLSRNTLLTFAQWAMIDGFERAA